MSIMYNRPFQTSAVDSTTNSSVLGDALSAFVGIFCFAFVWKQSAIKILSKLNLLK